MEEDFSIGDRVKLWFRGKWYAGTVVCLRPRPDAVRHWGWDFTKRILEWTRTPFIVVGRNDKYVFYRTPNPRGIVMDVWTDELVDDDPSGLFDGYGLTGPAKLGLLTIREGDEEYNPHEKLTSRPAQQEEDLDDDDFPF